MATSKIRVAVVDDDDSVRRALLRYLSISEVEAEGFGSGEEFLTSLRYRVPDCVILDLHMPGMSGLEVQQRLRLSRLRLPVVMITGHHEPGMRTKCLTAGAAVYLQKPIDGEVLVKAIEVAIGSASD